MKAPSETFEDIVFDYSRLIKATIQSYNPQRLGLDSDDLSQEALIKLWKHIDKKNEIRNIPALIVRMTNSVIIDQIRVLRQNHKKTDRAVYELETRALFRDNPSLPNQIHDAVRKIRSSRRDIVKLFLLDLSIEEIACILDQSAAKTRSLLYRGLNELKTILREIGIQYEY